MELARQYQRPDGSWKQIYAVPLASGDNTFVAETFKTPESQEKAGLVRHAVGYADLEFKGRTWQDRNGQKHFQQNVTLRSFELANRNLNAQGEEDNANAQQTVTQQDPESAATDFGRSDSGQVVSEQEGGLNF